MSPDSINNSIKSRGEARKVDLERSDGGKYEALEKDAKGISCQNRSNKESYEEDDNWMRDKNRRDMESSNASVILRRFEGINMVQIILR